MFRPTFIPVQVQLHEKVSTPPLAPYFVWLTTIPRNYKNAEITHAEIMVCEKCSTPVTLNGPRQSCTECASAYHYVGRRRRGLAVDIGLNTAPQATRYNHKMVGVVQDARDSIAVSVSAQIAGVVENDVTGSSRGVETYNDW
jgi:hypothetical protein